MNDKILTFPLVVALALPSRLHHRGYEIRARNPAAGSELERVPIIVLRRVAVLNGVLLRHDYVRVLVAV